MFEIPSAPAAAYVVAVMFSGSQDRYDYLVPANRRVSVGDVVNVETRRGIARATAEAAQEGE